MCWNKDVSLNTFLFACLGMLFIGYTNTFTKYKTPFFDDIYGYLIVLGFASIQLFEYFAWSNLKSPAMNSLVSKVGLAIIFAMPVTTLSAIGNAAIRNAMLMYYGVAFVLFIAYKNAFNPFVFTTTVAKNGHLAWNWLRLTGFEQVFAFAWVFFYFFKLYFEKDYAWAGACTLWFFLIYYLYLRDGTWGSMWCWTANFMILYYLIDVLILQPFWENGTIC